MPELSSGEGKEEFLCAAGEQSTEGGGGEKKTAMDRWKKMDGARGWPREFEGSVKGSDCSREK